MLLETLDHRLCDERQVGELYPLALRELLLTALAQGHQTRHVHFYHAPGMRSLVLAPVHPLRDGPPDARELHYPVALVNLHPLALRRGPGPWGGLRPLRYLGRGGSLSAVERRGGRRGLTLLDVALDVLLRHPAADAGAGDLLYVYVVLLGEP